MVYATKRKGTNQGEKEHIKYLEDLYQLQFLDSDNTYDD